MASSGWNLHRVYGLSFLDGCHQRSDVRQQAMQLRGSPNQDPCHPGDDSTNFSYAPRTWARGRVKGERPIDSKPSVSSPPTLFSHVVLLFPSLLLLSPPCVLIYCPLVDAHPRHAAVTHTSCKCSQGQPQLFHHSTKMRGLALPQTCTGCLEQNHPRRCEATSEHRCGGRHTNTVAVKTVACFQSRGS
jgi:hypothetical protein